MNTQYEKYINSTKWAGVRSRYWAEYGKSCKRCKSTKSLHVHHHTYARFTSELMSDLVGLCATCHELVHQEYNNRKDKKESLTAVTEKVVGVPLLSIPKKKVRKSKNISFVLNSVEAIEEYILCHRDPRIPVIWKSFETRNLIPKEYRTGTKIQEASKAVFKANLPHSKTVIKEVCVLHAKYLNMLTLDRVPAALHTGRSHSA